MEDRVFSARALARTERTGRTVSLSQVVIFHPAGIGMAAAIYKLEDSLHHRGTVSGDTARPRGLVTDHDLCAAASDVSPVTSRVIAWQVEKPTGGRLGIQ
ncbi:hypothetical protein F5Y10DRAFT_269091 [Nemania abortiva]|nr:hypothetical protein F5Y10DRAFT_269091 [Nemania abortiva]